MKKIHDVKQTKLVTFLNLLECSPGYFGPNCTFQCPYPTYGEECQRYCDCANYSCDFATGCALLTTGTYFDILVLAFNKRKIVKIERKSEQVHISHFNTA